MMTQQEVHVAVAGLASERGWAEGSPAEVYLLELFTAREDVRRSLLHSMDLLRQDLDRLGKILQAPSPLLNNLGELQQRPAAVEAAVGEFHAADKALSAYLKTFPPVDPF